MSGLVKIGVQARILRRIDAKWVRRLADSGVTADDFTLVARGVGVVPDSAYVLPDESGVISFDSGVSPDDADVFADDSAVIPDGFPGRPARAAPICH